MGWGWLRGRSNRTLYWSNIALLVLIYTAITVAYHPEHLVGGEFFLMLIYIPRLHDVGVTGWIGAAPLTLKISAIATLSLLPTDPALIVAGVMLLIIAVSVVVVGVIPGQPAANRFGDPPRSGFGFTGRAQAPPDVFD